MSPSATVPARGFFTGIAGDACLLTTAAFALVAGTIGGIMGSAGLIGPDGPIGVLGAILSVGGSLLGIAAVIAGPIVSWRLHGRAFGTAEIAGIVVGVVGGAVVMVAGSFAVAGIGTGISALTGSEFGGAIVVLAALIIAFLVIIARLDIDAVRDMRRERHEHRRLDILRLGATGVLAAFAVVMAVLVRTSPGAGEYGTAVPFALGAGVVAGVVAGIADMWVRRKESKQAGVRTAVSA